MKQLKISIQEEEPKFPTIPTPFSIIEEFQPINIIEGMLEISITTLHPFNEIIYVGKTLELLLKLLGEKLKGKFIMEV